jgi:hypothetical protein
MEATAALVGLPCAPIKPTIAALSTSWLSSALLKGSTHCK